MENINLPPFYIGQKVVRIKTNKIHTVKNMAKISCGCWVVEIDVSYQGKGYDAFDYCPKHGFITPFYHEYKGWIQAISLRPVQEAKPPLIKLTLSKIKETEKEQILIEN